MTTRGAGDRRVSERDRWKFTRGGRRAEDPRQARVHTPAAEDLSRTGAASDSAVSGPTRGRRYASQRAAPPSAAFEKVTRNTG